MTNIHAGTILQPRGRECWRSARKDPKLRGRKPIRQSASGSLPSSQFSHAKDSVVHLWGRARGQTPPWNAFVTELGAETRTENDRSARKGQRKNRRIFLASSAHISKQLLGAAELFLKKAFSALRTLGLRCQVQHSEFAYQGWPKAGRSCNFAA